MNELIDTGDIKYVVSDVLKHYEWVFCDGIYVVNPKYFDKFRAKHGLQLD